MSVHASPGLDSLEPTCIVYTRLYAHNTGEHDKNILNMERALFGMKCKFPMKKLSITVFGGKTSNMHTDITITFFHLYFYRPK
jgi:hypothetical protein